mgnify:CR=1 FL=1
MLATCDEAHMWLAPFTRGERHTVTVILPQGCRPSRLKIWNYNANRAHTQRGARRAEVRLSGSLLFQGELRQASGIVVGAAAHVTTMTFTDTPQVRTSSSEKSSPTLPYVHLAAFVGLDLLQDVSPREVARTFVAHQLHPHLPIRAARWGWGLCQGRQDHASAPTPGYALARPLALLCCVLALNTIAEYGLCVSSEAITVWDGERGEYT